MQQRRRTQGGRCLGSQGMAHTCTHPPSLHTWGGWGSCWSLGLGCYKGEIKHRPQRSYLVVVINAKRVSIEQHYCVSDHRVGLRGMWWCFGVLTWWEGHVSHSDLHFYSSRPRPVCIRMCPFRPCHVMLWSNFTSDKCKPTFQELRKLVQPPHATLQR